MKIEGFSCTKYIIVYIDIKHNKLSFFETLRLAMLKRMN